MRKVYMSFLGRGSVDKNTGKYDYRPVVYTLDKKAASEVRYVQVAEMELLRGEQFDAVIIVATELSHKDHFEDLQVLLKKINVAPIPVIIEDDMTSQGQWKMFEKILTHIEPGDSLTLDLTHGYRSTVIIFSAAINFLQKARNITLDAVYYGAYEKKDDQDQAPIIDMKDFYLINEWADGVSRLVEDADARKLAATAEKTPTFQIGELNDQKIISAFEDLTNAIRNVDVNNVSQKADYALKLIQGKMTSASTTGQILLKLVLDKFTNLTIHGHQTNRYDLAYFNIQIEIIKILMTHKLYMQAYTVMREFIASVGMIGIKKATIASKRGRGYRTCYAEIFSRMIQNEQKEWIFNDERAETAKNTLMPHYEKLAEIGVLTELKSFAREMIDYRNGFDHAWTAKPGAYQDIPAKGEKFLKHLETVIRLLAKHLSL